MKDPIREVTPKLLNDLKAVARSFGFRERDLEDIVQDAFIRTAEATWDWCPSKQYLKTAVRSAGEKFMKRRPAQEVLVDFQALEAHEDPDEDDWQVRDLYYKRTDEPLDDDEYQDGDPLDLVDFMAMGFNVFEQPRALGEVEREVLSTLTREVVRPEAEERDPLPSLEAILEAFTERDRALLEDRLVDRMSLRALAAKYGLSKSTLQRRLKNIEAAFSSKADDVLAKPSRQKKKSKKKRSSGTRRVIVAKPVETAEPISA